MNAACTPDVPARPFALCAVLIAFTALAAAGTPALKVYFASDFKVQAYQQKAYAKAASSWKMPGDLPEVESKAVVTTTILEDGALGETKIHHKSGSAAWDAAGLAAIKAAAPFDPLPDSYPQPSVEVHFHFEYGP